MNITKAKPVFFDVDETLVLHERETRVDEWGNFVKSPVTGLRVTDPLNPEQIIVVWPHAPMIRLLREEHAKGHKIYVWSRGGHEWAANVILALGLQDLVAEVLDKPFAYFDDLPIEQWLTNRVYIKPGTTYKGVK